MAKAVLAKMGIAEVDGVLTEFGSLIPGLKAGRFDIIAAGMFVNPARCNEIAFSEPSYGIGQAMLVPAGNPKGIVDYASFADNADLKLAVMAGAVEAGYANDAGVGLGPGRQPARPGEPRRRRPGRPRRRRGADRALDRRHGLEGRRRRVRPSRSARSPASRSRATAPSASARRTRTSSTPSTPSSTTFLGTPEHIALVEPFGFGADYLPNQTTAELCAGE